MNPLNFDIVILALPRWDGKYSSTAYSLAQALSMHTRVFYIDNPFTIKDFIVLRNSMQIKRRRQALLGGKSMFRVPNEKYPELIAVTPPLVFPINWLPPGKLYNAFSKINDWIVAQALNAILEEHSLRNFVFINSFNPLYGRNFPSTFSPQLKIYHSVDDISKSQYIAKHGTRLESEAVKNADFSLVTSLELKRLKSQESPAVFYLPNAANVELFQQAVTRDLPKPVEIRDLPAGKKIILYMGNICHRLDYVLLKKIVEQNRDKILLMVGPLSNDNYKKAGLDRFPQVVFTGSKSLDELPAYVKYSHCCIIPFLCTPLTKSIYPLKINEYLSAGKPVVTTNFSADIASFRNVAFISDSHEEFLDNITLAIKTDSTEQISTRVQYSSSNNWEARASQLIELINANWKRHDN